MAVQSLESPNVEVIERRQLPVIQVNGRHLLTVTEQDAPAGRTAPEQAQLWAQRVEGAIQRGQQQRSPVYVRRALFFAASSVLVAIAAHWSLGWVWHHWLHRFTPKAMLAETAAFSEGIELLHQLTLTLVRSGVWLVAAIYISNLFPLTRIGSRQIANNLFASLDL